MQREMALLAEATKELREVEDRLIALCPSEQAAFRLCISQSRVYRSQDVLAEDLGMTKGALNAILNSDQGKRQRYMPRIKQTRLQELCQNKVIDRWADLESSGLLNCQRTAAQELADAEALVARLRAERGVA